MMSVLKIILILVVMVPSLFIMFRTAADVRRDIQRHKRAARGESSQGKKRFRVVK